LADDAGSLLLRAGLVTRADLRRVREAVVAAGGTIGEKLVLAELIDDEALTAFYRNRLLVPRIDPNDLARISSRVVRLLPEDMAVEFRVMPVYLDRDQNLTLAMSDPSNTHAADEIGFFTGAYIVRAVATQRQIAWCLAHYYGALTPLGETLLEPVPATSVGGDPAAAAAAADDDDDDEVEMEVEIEMEAEEPDRPKRPSTTGVIRAMRHPVVAPVDRPKNLDRPTDDSVEDRAARMFSGRPASAPPRKEPDEPDTGPTQRLSPKRSRPRPATPPELAARAGEVEINQNVRTKPDSVARILVDQEALSPPEPEPPAARESELEEAVPEALDEAGTESRPILLATRSEPPAADASEEVVLLEQPKRARRRSRRTRLGVGAVGSKPPEPHPAAPRGRPQHDTLVDAPPVDAPPVEEAPASASYEEATTNPRLQYETEDVDEAWGAPGTTIPPAYLGALPGTYEESEPGTSIPIPLDDELSTPHSIAHATRPRVETGPVSPRNRAEGGPPETTSSDLEESSLRLVSTLRQLDRTTVRDAVIEELIDHLRDICSRVAFFAARGTTLRGFTGRGADLDLGRLKQAELSLERPSTLRDAVRARLPYHGPVGDEPTREFLQRAFGEPPAEILAVPVAVRERVVGILYGDGKRRPLFSAHLAAISHAAGLALERILKAQKS
jgi:hypothetical protein